MPVVAAAAVICNSKYFQHCCSRDITFNIESNETNLYDCNAVKFSLYYLRYYSRLSVREQRDRISPVTPYKLFRRQVWLVCVVGPTA